MVVMQVRWVEVYIVIGVGEGSMMVTVKSQKIRMILSIGVRVVMVMMVARG